MNEENKNEVSGTFAGKKIKRTRFIIKPELQLKYIAYVALVILVTGFTMFNFIRLKFTASTVISTFLSKLNPSEVDLIYKVLFHTIAFVTADMILLFIIVGVFLFHKITGPLYAMEQMFRSIASGNLSINRSLRKGDELKSFFEEFQAMVETLRYFAKEDKDILEQVKNDLSFAIENVNNIPTSDLQAKLSSIRANLDKVYSKIRL